MKVNGNFIKSYLNSIKSENMEIQFKKIKELLDNICLEYETLTGINGNVIIEVYNMYFIIDTNEKFVLIELD